MQRQLVITEKAEPSHIAAWLSANCRQVVIVWTDVVTDAVRKSVELARRSNLPIEYSDEGVRRSLST